MPTKVTAEQFANTWTRSFATAVRKAAGRDGRLSELEAERMGGLPKGLGLFADNAQGFFYETGQASVSVNKLLRSSYEEALGVARELAGADGLLGADELAQLPTHFRPDALYLWGEKPTAADDDHTRLVKQARRFVLENAGGGWDAAKGKLFPEINGGYSGMSVHLLEGDSGKLLADLVNLWTTRGTQRVDYDPSRHAMLSVATSDDECRLYACVMDRQTGKATLLGELELVDTDWHLSEADFERLFPLLDPQDWGDYDIAEALAAGGTKIDVGSEASAP